MREAGQSSEAPSGAEPSTQRRVLPFTLSTHLRMLQRGPAPTRQVPCYSRPWCSQKTMARQHFADSFEIAKSEDLRQTNVKAAGVMTAPGGGRTVGTGQPGDAHGP